MILNFLEEKMANMISHKAKNKKNKFILIHIYLI